MGKRREGENGEKREGVEEKREVVLFLGRGGKGGGMGKKRE